MPHEEKIKPGLKKEVVYEDTTWYLDTEARNHMMECHDHFIELDETVT